MRCRGSASDKHQASNREGLPAFATWPLSTAEAVPGSSASGSASSKARTTSGGESRQMGVDEEVTYAVKALQRELDSNEEQLVIQDAIGEGGFGKVYSGACVCVPAGRLLADWC